MDQAQSGLHSGQSKSIRTLLIDDSSFDRKRIRRFGARIGMPIDFEETSSLKGLQRCLERQNYDLFLIDFAMPNGDGLEALDLIRSHEHHRAAASIMISGNSDNRTVVSAMKRGCHDFIAKDVMSAELLKQTILEALKQRSSPSSWSIAGDQQSQIEQMKTLFQAALNDPSIRDIIRKPLEEELRAATRGAGLGSQLEWHSSYQLFMNGFFETDEFEFR